MPAQTQKYNHSGQDVGGGLSSSSSTPKTHCNFGRTCGVHVRSSVSATIKVHSIVGKVQSSTWYGSKFDPPVQSSVHFNRTSSTFKVDRAWKCVKTPKIFGVCLSSTASVFSHVQSSPGIAIYETKNVYFNVQTELAQWSTGPRQSSIQSKPKFNLKQPWYHN